ncbi:GNAT family N-acetyltransferase [Streptomyces sp. NBC_01221]|uniref:GNAT family N-acetyltransferase n=1 Tax=Streptomyces sp. NBC_01221 TaxID=2903782 RepID=UPI00225B83FF|nr:GNAT family N-acetyltransferase [Streptomyces sp. NBC_01221]MCX4791948.1 GNAT family N-acetyltransferase [Streptomyces sp. NBC_01221]
MRAPGRGNGTNTTVNLHADIARSTPPRLEPVRYDHPQARRLTRGLHAEQLALYGFADDPEATPVEDFEPPTGLFVLAYPADSTEAAGCGGWRLLDPQTAEIKRMFVHPTARRASLARQILEFLEQQAAVSGATRLVLETGCLNAAALGLYQRSGYCPLPSYVSGRNPKVNRALGKPLSPPALRQEEDPDARHG